MSLRPSLKVTSDQNAEEAPEGFDGEAARRSFLRMMSHELRTPLNSIIGFADVLKGEPHGPLGAPQYREYVDIISVSGQRLLHLVNQALEIIRLEAGTADLQMGAQGLTVAIDDACQFMAAEAEARGISITFDPPWPGPQVLGDAKALRTIATNLIQNAITWSPEGGVVWVGIEVEADVVNLIVRDEGEGVDPEIVSRLMQPFEQGDAALRRYSEGAGLGWPLVRLLVKAMGGRFLVDPGPGKGLTATVTLRRAG